MRDISSDQEEMEKLEKVVSSELEAGNKNRFVGKEGFREVELPRVSGLGFGLQLAKGR